VKEMLAILAVIIGFVLLWWLHTKDSYSTPATVIGALLVAFGLATIVIPHALLSESSTPTITGKVVLVAMNGDVVVSKTGKEYNGVTVYKSDIDSPVIVRYDGEFNWLTFSLPHDVLWMPILSCED
jgi:hypothetical protein